MKRFESLFGIVTLTLTLAAQVQAQDSLTNGLVAYYPFNGNANDESENGNNGAIVGYDYAYGLDRFGGVNSLYLNRTSTPAVSLDGAHVLAPRSPLLDFNKDFTLSTWVNLRSGTPPLFPQNFICNGSDATTVNLRVVSDHSDFGGQDLLDFVWRTLGGNEQVAVLVAPVRETWWQTTVVRSGSTVSLFKNGVRLASANMATPVTNSPTMWLGNQAGLGYPLIGGIDDVRMYNRALSTIEVQELYLAEENCIPHAAIATARISGGFVVAIDVIDTGCGYTNPPVVQIQGGGGTGATATAVISHGGVISIKMADAGIGYASVPTVKIASPPFTPWLDIGVSKVKVTQHVVLGRKYLLEASLDLQTWTPAGPEFVAQSETIVNEFDVAETGRFFRIKEVP